MVYQVLERKYISYDKLAAKLTELFPGDAIVQIKVWDPSAWFELKLKHNR